MCDIIVAMPDTTASGHVLFGKNSDRPAGECQVWYDSRAEARSATIPCAFVAVPESSVRLATRGCRPYWCWGYETGMNEAGVVGGNTAVYTRALHLPENRREFGLSGMELLRLGLERGRRAAEAVEAITGLLARYGQWGAAVQGKDAPEGCYENAFLIADAHEAWILETSGRRFAARRFTNGVYSLSNQLTIREEWTSASDDLLDHAIAHGWWRHGREAFDFALAFSDHEHYARQVSHPRWQRSRALLEHHAGRVDPAVMMGILRDHYRDTFLAGPMFSEFLPDLLTLCMHDSPAGFTWGNTATSVIVDIDPDAPGSSVYWSCYQPPCTSVYIAATMDADIPAPLAAAGTAGLRSQSPVAAPPDTFDARSLWWRMFRLLTAVSDAPAARLDELRTRFGAIERRALVQARSVEGEPAAQRSARVRRTTQEQLREVMGVVAHLERTWGIPAG